jgi:hypothetical protein
LVRRRVLPSALPAPTFRSLPRTARAWWAGVSAEVLAQISFRLASGCAIQGPVRTSALNWTGQGSTSKDTANGLKRAAPGQQQRGQSADEE